MNPVLRALLDLADRHGVAPSNDPQALAGKLVDRLVVNEERLALARQHAARAAAAVDPIAADVNHLREGLALILAELPKGTVAAGTGHLAHVTQGRAAVRITDPAALPPHLLRQRDPEPNKAAILAAIQSGEAVPGAALVNPAPSLRLLPRKENAA